MRVYYNCPNCKHENPFNTNVGTRVEFEMKYGKTKRFECTKCLQNFMLSANKIYAKQSKPFIILSGAIFLIGTVIGLFFVIKMISEMKSLKGILAIACGLLIPSWIFEILNKEERNRIRTFNQTYVSE